MKSMCRKIPHLYNIYRQKRDDRGSAIVIVIMAMAMIGILATTLLWMAYMNYMIKAADIRNKNSFYSAEEVVEQIMAGLRQESADAAGIAYRDVLANWDNLETAQNRYHVFSETYKDTLLEKLKDTHRGSGFYDRDKLKAYIDADIFLETVPGAGVDVDAWDSHNPAGEPRMEMVNNSIILRSLYVSYTDSENRVSIVQTDICMDVPKLAFEDEGSIDGLYEYTLIGNDGIEVTGAGGMTTVQGNIFAGTDAAGKGGLVIEPANTLTVDSARRVICKGDIVVKGPAAGFVVRDMPGQDNRVYARNIMLDRGTVSLDSKTYVANDLTLDGVGSKATLTKEYYGYGYAASNGLPGEEDVDSAASSAIIINGRDSTLDMSGINRLLIAGRSYIGQASSRAQAEYNRAETEAGRLIPQQPVMMGESIAVKGGQIAYLVPAECIGTLDGECVIGQNPIYGDKISDLEAMKKENTDGSFCEVDFSKKIYRLGNQSLSEFGVTDMDHIRTINVQYRGSVMRYYYVVLDRDNAERYFVQYYNFHANRESIDRYFNKYVSGGILLGDFTAPENAYTILGNSLVSSALTDSGVTLLTSIDQTALNPSADPDSYVETGENAVQVDNKQDILSVAAQSEEIAKVYQALCFNLTEDGSGIPTDPEAAKNCYVFSNLIKEAEVLQYLDAHHTDRVIYGTDSGLRAVLTREPIVSVSELETISEKPRLIVSLGDVVVDRDYTGLIAARGRITIQPATVTSIRQDKMDLYQILEARSEIAGDTITPVNMFVNGTGSMIDGAGIPGGAQTPDVDDAGNPVIDYTEIVKYMNWVKK